MKTFFWRTPEFRGKFAIFLRKDLFFGKHLRFVSLASSIPVLSLERVCPRKVGPWPETWIFGVCVSLASSLVS